MQELVIKEQDFKTAGQLHAYLKEQLNFPEFYGANLGALNDCLTSRIVPLRITVLRDNSIEDPWFDRLCSVLGRIALENDAIDVVCRNA